jgi:predicted Zn-dependent protease with MMP-like domain
MPKRQRAKRARPARRATRYHGIRPRDYFETVVDRVIRTIDPRLAPALDEVAIVIEEWPSDEQLRDQGLDEDDWLYGLYEGTPTSLTADWPRKITLFREPLEEDFPDPVDLEREIRLTIEHELAHHFSAEDSYDDGADEEDEEPAEGLRARIWRWMTRP